MNLAFRVFALLVLLAGCPSRRTTLGGQVPDVPSNGDKRAHDRFEDLRRRFLQDARSVPAEDFKRLIEEFPADPIVPWADLYAGIAALKARNFTEADKQLTQVMNAGTGSPSGDLQKLAAKAKVYLGITKNYEGDLAAARALLDTREPAIDEESRVEYYSALAFSLAAGAPEEAARSLPVFDSLWDQATPTERAVILGRVEEVVAALPAELLWRIFKDLPNRRGPSIAFVGTRLALDLEASGDTAAAADMSDKIVPIRIALGLSRTLSMTGAGGATGRVNPGLVGAVLPIGGQSDAVAQRAVEGLGLAAGAPSGTGVVAIEIRAAIAAPAAAAAVDQLAGQNVIAIVGPIGDASVDAGADRADALGVPLLTLTPHAIGRKGGTFVFHMRHSPEARARVLAKRALAKGIKTFAVFAPDNDYGKATTAAFSAEIVKGGGSIVETVTYPPIDPVTQKPTKSFAAFTGKLTKDWDALFAPAESDSLELIAPALAATGHVPKSLPFPAKKKLLLGRPIMLLSTAEDLKEAFLLNAARHADGALLAPGYYPDNAEPANQAFIAQHMAAYGRAPGATAAYAYDAAQLAAAAGGSGRAALAQTLSKGQLTGVTGTIKFDGTTHQRADDGIVYTVVEETGGVWAIRVAR
ncbi:MAG: Extracellular ligand-binding receptor [Myxococcales bacterium]|nr:Extracellular ligand-binding receptor [Myxococcales bacterium]